MNIGEKIKFLRSDNNLTQKELANKLHVSSQAISNWELNKGFPDISNLIRISDMFNISLDEIIKEDNDLKENLLEGKIERNVNLVLSSIAAVIFIIIFILSVVKVIQSEFRELHIMGLVVGLLGSASFSREVIKYLKQ